MPVTEDTKPNDSLGGFTSFKQKYRSMKSKLKAILYENELFQDELQKLQRELLDIYRDKETLLERVAQFEDIGSSSSDSESQTSDKECEIKSIKNEPQAIPTSNNIIINTTTNNNTTTNINNKPKPASSSKRRIASPSTTVTAAKRNNNGTISNNTGPKPLTNGKSTVNTIINNSVCSNSYDNKRSVSGIVIKTDSQPSNGAAVDVAGKITATGSATSTSKITPAKPKAPSRNRSKAATTNNSNNKNGTKSNPNGTKVTTTTTTAANKAQKQNVNNNKQQQQPKAINNGRVQIHKTAPTNQINLISQVTTLEPTMNNNLVPSMQQIARPPNHNLNEIFQQQSMTVISGHVPITTANQINLVPQVTTIEPNGGNNLVPSIQTIARQPNHTIGDQYQQQQQQQQQSMTVISNRVPVATNQINIVPQATTMVSTLTNNLIPSIQTLAGQPNHSLGDHFQQQHQMIQQHQLHHPQQHHIPDPQTTIALGVDSTQQLQQPIMTAQSNQTVWWWQQQQHQQQHHQPQTAPTHQIVTSNGQIMRHQTQTTDEVGVTVVGGVHDHQLDHDLNQECSTPQDVLDSYNSPGQQQQQHHHHHIHHHQQQQSHESQQQSHQHHLQQQSQQQHHQQTHNSTDAPQQQQSSSSSTNHLSEQSKQDLNNQQQQQNSAYSTQQHQLTTTEQLSAEELEQHLESRRMEQAALLLPDWETSVPSEIFSTDSAIKFMAED